MKTLIIDNYDSYTYNLFQLISEVNGEEAVVVRNDAATWEELRRRRFDNVVISPGPGTPERPGDFGICADVLATPDLPILGVCLGHQGLAHVNGGAVARAPDAVHGRISPVFHDESPLFAGIPQGFAAVRYHSLLVDAGPRGRPALGLDGRRDGDGPRASGAAALGRPVPSRVDLHGARTAAAGELPRPQPRVALAPRRRPARPPAERARRLGRRARPSGGPQVLLAAHRPARRSGDRVRAPLRRQRFAYWLDSSLVSDGLSRFSYIGASGGPLSRVVSYDAAGGA